MYFAKFNVDGLLHGDYKSRKEGYSIGRQNGRFPINDIRQIKYISLVPPKQGDDDYLINSSMMSAQVGQQIKTKEKDEGSSDGEEYEQKGTENAPAR